MRKKPQHRDGFEIWKAKQQKERERCPDVVLYRKVGMEMKALFYHPVSVLGSPSWLLVQH